MMGKNKAWEINKLVQQYKNGGDSSELISCYNNWFKKWIDLLKGRVIRSDDNETRRFYGLMWDRFHSVADITSFIKKLTNNITDYDIYTDLVILFLKIIKRYEDKRRNGGVVSYIANYFYFEVKNYIYSKERQEDILDKDILSLDMIKGISTDISLFPEWNITIAINQPDMTDFHSYILNLYYNFNMTDKDIADRLLYTRSYITEQRHLAESYVRSYLVNNGYYEYSI